MDDRMRVIAQGHEDVENSLEIGLSRKAASVGIYSTERERASGSSIGITIINDLFNEAIDLCSKERRTRYVR